LQITASFLTDTDTDVDLKTYSVRLQGRGQIAVPQAVRRNLLVREGDILTLLQIGEVVLLTPKQLQVPLLADRFATRMKAENVGLADLLLGLEEEREAIWQERQQDG
jgi:bifunctional DNA-binding transcriptional regulator/antitoxin component of YhaV-PrlF toxin-antitoxin module